MQHRTKVLRTTTGYTGVCSCGYYTPDGTEEQARVAINDHEITALKHGVKVTYLEPAQTDALRLKKT